MTTDGENSNPEAATNETSEKTYTADEVSKKILKRVGNLHEENEALKRKIEELSKAQESMSSQQREPTQAAIPDEIFDRQAEVFGEALRKEREEAEKRRQEEELQSNINTYKAKVQKMLDEDADFKKIALDTEKSNPIPEDVTLHIASQFDAKKAKDVLSELLTNKVAHMKMENAYLKAERDGGKAYNDWVNSLVKTGGETPKAPDIQDLSGQSVPADSGGYDNIDDYILGR